MDPWINSLVQSPLVRSLNTVPGRMSSFAHGMKDNIPPVSFQKVVVQPYQTDTTKPAATHRFRVPQYGLLDRAYVRMRLNSKYNPNMVRTTSTLVDTSQRPPWTSCVHETSCASSSWNYADALVGVSLQTNNKVIESIPAECIAAEVVKMPPQIREFFEKGMCGYAAGGGSTTAFAYSPDIPVTIGTGGGQTEDLAASNVPFPALLNPPSVTSTGSSLRRYRSLWDPSARATQLTQTQLAAAWDVKYVEGMNNHADFIIPLPFSCLDQLKDNYQTRFVEPLEIHITTKDYAHGIHGRGAAAGLDYYEVELVLLYHNFHDTIENAIRDSNFKRGFPASVYAHDWVEESVSVSGNKATVEFRSNNLVSEIIMVRQHKQDPSYVYGSTYNIGKLDLASAAGDETHNMLLPRQGKSLRIALSGSGRELWSGTEMDLIGPDVADYELTDGHPYGEDLSLHGPSMHSARRDDSVVPSRQTPLNALVVGAYPSAKFGGVYLGFDRNLMSMRMGFQANSHFYTGGLAFQTLSNPTLTIETADGTAFGNQTFRVYVKYNTLQRINSDTGVITRTLDV
jgi:hypothetical protein